MTRADLQREKLLNAMIFFTENTRHCHKLKLFKLLFFLDFEIFRQTGKTVTDLVYFAWPMGPVPNKLVDELKAPRPDMSAAIRITSASSIDEDFGSNALLFKPKRPFDDDCFTRREMAEMERLAEIYREAYAKQMTDVSHLRGAPWHTIYEVQKKHQAVIPYELALDGKPDSITKERAEEIRQEERELSAFFK